MRTSSRTRGLPDRDLFVFNTETDTLEQVVTGIGTLLYGLAVDSDHRVFVAQTDARNVENGRAGTRKDGLEEMDNRAFLNQITRVDCAADCGSASYFNLEPPPPQQPAPGMALATPFGIQVSDNNATLVVTAAGSNKLFTVDTDTGAVTGRVTVGATPRGIALVSDDTGAATAAWVLNAVGNTVSLVDLTTAKPAVTATIALDDPTHPDVKRGRIAFNDANASSTGTFSCESCHPECAYRPVAVGAENTAVRRGGLHPDSAAPDHARARAPRYGAVSLGWHSGGSIRRQQHRFDQYQHRTELQHRPTGKLHAPPGGWHPGRHHVRPA